MSSSRYSITLKSRLSALLPGRITWPEEILARDEVIESRRTSPSCFFGAVTIEAMLDQERTNAVFKERHLSGVSRIIGLNDGRYRMSNEHREEQDRALHETATPGTVSSHAWFDQTKLSECQHEVSPSAGQGRVKARRANDRQEFYANIITSNFLYLLCRSFCQSSRENYARPMQSS